MCDITITGKAAKELDRVDRAVVGRLLTAILSLCHNPRPPGCLKIQATKNTWRIRVGDYRIGYTIDDAAKSITVIHVGSRGGFYD